MKAKYNYSLMNEEVKQTPFEPLARNRNNDLKFEDFIKTYSETDLENNFESIVSDFVNFEYSEFKKQGRYSWVFSIPNKITGVKFIPFEEFKEKINETLNIPGAEQKEVLKRFKDDYITKALEIDKVQKIYTNYKSGKEEILFFSSLTAKFSYYAKKCAIIELIKLEKYLNEFKNDSIEPKAERKNPGRKKAIVKDAREYLKFEMDGHKEIFLKEIKKHFPNQTPKEFNHLILVLKKIPRISEATNKEIKEAFEKELNLAEQSQANFNFAMKNNPDLSMFEGIEKTVKNIILTNSLV